MSRILICGDSNSLGEWGTVIPGPAVANNDHPDIFKPYNKEEYLKEPHAKPFNVVWPGFGYELDQKGHATVNYSICLLYTSPSPRDRQKSRMPSSA